MRVQLDGVFLDVEYTYSPPQKGSRDKYGVPLEPDDPETVEIAEIWLDDNDLTTLLDGRMQEIETLVLEGLQSGRRAA